MLSTTMSAMDIQNIMSTGGRGIRSVRNGRLEVSLGIPKRVAIQGRFSESSADAEVWRGEGGKKRG